MYIRIQASLSLVGFGAFSGSITHRGTLAIDHRDLPLAGLSRAETGRSVRKRASRPQVVDRHLVVQRMDPEAQSRAILSTTKRHGAIGQVLCYPDFVGGVRLGKYAGRHPFNPEPMHVTRRSASGWLVCDCVMSRKPLDAVMPSAVSMATPGSSARSPATSAPQFGSMGTPLVRASASRTTGLLSQANARAILCLTEICGVLISDASRCSAFRRRTAERPGAAFRLCVFSGPRGSSLASPII